MAVINPHTTRATGTVLTAAIYNTDHQNHITNANNLNAELAGVSGVGASTGIIVSNGAAVISGRTLQGTANQISILNANGLAADPVISIATNPILPGNVTIGGTFATLVGAVNLSPAGQTVTIAPTGVGAVTINPNTVGSINKMNIGATTPGTGKFTTLTATGASVLAGVTADTLSMGGTITMNAGSINFGTGGNGNVGTSSGSTSMIIYAGGGTCYLRPNGAASTVGQFFVQSTGNATVNGTLTVTG